MEGYIVRILHISDLHFGIKTGKNVTKEKIAERNYFMDDLVKGLGSITESQPLDYIFITGDIACTASEKEYTEAGTWLKKLSEACRVPARRIYICPGNHDTEREKSGESPELSKGTDELLCMERFEKQMKRYENYQHFCQNAGLPSYELDGRRNYLSGVAANPSMNVICLNTNWFVEKGKRKENPEIATGLVEQIKKEKKYENHLPTITIMHHPVYHWNEKEKSNGAGSRQVHAEVCNISDMILTGHAHKKEDGCGYQNETYICGNGAVYKEKAYHHNFHIYEWESGKTGAVDCLRTTYLFDGSKWYKRAQTIRLQLGKQKKKSDKQPLKYSFSVLWWMR